ESGEIRQLASSFRSGQMSDQDMLDAAQYVEQPQRKADPVASETRGLRRSNTGGGQCRIEIRRVLDNPIAPAIGHADLGIGDMGRLHTTFPAVILARSRG